MTEHARPDLAALFRDSRIVLPLEIDRDVAREPDGGIVICRSDHEGRCWREELEFLTALVNAAPRLIAAEADLATSDARIEIQERQVGAFGVRVLAAEDLLRRLPRRMSHARVQVPDPEGGPSRSACASHCAKCAIERHLGLESTAVGRGR